MNTAATLPASLKKFVEDAMYVAKGNCVAEVLGIPDKVSVTVLNGIVEYTAAALGVFCVAWVKTENKKIKPRNAT